MTIYNPRNLIIDHDAGVDDLAAIAIAALSRQFQLDAITLCPADSFKESAIQITAALVKFLNLQSVRLAASDNEGINLFPEKWRKDSFRLSQIAELKLAPQEYSRYGYTSKPASQVLVELLSGSKNYEVLATGPLSNIADALKLDKTIARNIKKIYFMGGAFKVHGNVEDPNHDLTAEWNVYNNPQAVADVLAAGIRVAFVSLDATNKTPVTRGFMRALKAQNESGISQLFYKVWNVIAPQIENENYQNTYFFWDTLTASVASQLSLGQFREERVRVVTEGKSQGRTLFDPLGVPAEVLEAPDAAAFEAFLLKTLRRN